jgi:hypothetical protein
VKEAFGATDGLSWSPTRWFRAWVRFMALNAGIGALVGIAAAVAGYAWFRNLRCGGGAHPWLCSWPGFLMFALPGGAGGAVSSVILALSTLIVFTAEMVGAELGSLLWKAGRKIGGPAPRIMADAVRLTVASLQAGRLKGFPRILRAVLVPLVVRSIPAALASREVDLSGGEAGRRQVMEVLSGAMSLAVTRPSLYLKLWGLCSIVLTALALSGVFLLALYLSV